MGLRGENFSKNMCLFQRRKDRHSDRIHTQRFTPWMFAAAKGRSQALHPCLPQGGLELGHLSRLLLPSRICRSRKLESGVGDGTQVLQCDLCLSQPAS